MDYLMYVKTFLLWFDHFLDTWAEICQIFRWFFGKFKISKRHSEIIWPLPYFTFFTGTLKLDHNLGHGMGPCSTRRALIGHHSRGIFSLIEIGMVKSPGLFGRREVWKSIFFLITGSTTGLTRCFDKSTKNWCSVASWSTIWNFLTTLSLNCLRQKGCHVVY